MTTTHTCLNTLVLALLVACGGRANDDGDSADDGELESDSGADSGVDSGDDSGGNDDPDEVVVEVRTPDTVVRPLEEVQLTVEVTGSDEAVEWDVESGGGQVDDNGLFTADDDVGTAVVAACVMDVCDSVSLTVERGGTLSISGRVDHSDVDWVYGYAASADGLVVVGSTLEDRTTSRTAGAWVVPLSWSAELEEDRGGAQWFEMSAATDAAFDAEGNLVVVGRNFLLRLDPSGALDPTLDEDGVRSYTYDDTFGEVAVDSADGYLVATSDTLTRLDSDGTPDLRFGVDGEIDLTVDDDTFVLVDFRLDGDDIVVLGRSAAGLVYGRFDASGKPDGRVSTSGLRVATLEGESLPPEVEDFSLDSEGRMLVAWGRDDGAVQLARIGVDGRLDEAFGYKGIATTLFDDPDTVNNFTFEACCTSIDEEGRIVVAGSDSPALLVTRFLPSGDLDPAWGDEQLLYSDDIGEVAVEGVEVGPRGEVAVLAVIDDRSENDDDLALYILEP